VDTKKIFRLLYLVFSLALLCYLALPAPSMPAPLPDSVKSDEPADLESPFRVGFYTDLTREEVISYYKSQFSYSPLLGIEFPSFRLNYPPEEAQTLIRDQTASTFLEELAHPGRESLYINGYEPKVDQNPVVAVGRPWKQKVIIRYVRSVSFVRLAVGVLALMVLYMLIIEGKHLWVSISKEIKKWRTR
jgi:hypothetical protein